MKLFLSLCVFSWVHITKQTKDFLGPEFANFCRSNRAKQKDKYLEENNIETFFLTPPKSSQTSVASPTNSQQRFLLVIKIMS